MDDTISISEIKIWHKEFTLNDFSRLIYGYNGNKYPDPNTLLSIKYSDHKTYPHKRLLKRDYIFLCNQIFGSENDFKLFAYGRILTWRFNSLSQKIHNWDNLLVNKIYEILMFESDELSDLLKPKLSSKENLNTLIKSELKILSRFKAGDDDSVSVYYDIEIGNCKFKKTIAELREFSGRPAKIYFEFKKKEALLNSNIDEFNREYLKGLYLVKIINPENIDLRKMATQTITTHHNISLEKVEELKSDLLKAFKTRSETKDYRYVLIEKELLSNPENYFSVINFLNRKELFSKFIN